MSEWNRGQEGGTNVRLSMKQRGRKKQRARKKQGNRAGKVTRDRSETSRKAGLRGKRVEIAGEENWMGSISKEGGNR